MPFYNLSNVGVCKWERPGIEVRKYLPSVTSEYVPHHTWITLTFNQSACVKAGFVKFSSGCGDDAGILMADGYTQKLELGKINNLN